MSWNLVLKRSEGGILPKIQKVNIVRGDLVWVKVVMW